MALEHVVIVTLVVATLETVCTEAHALRDATSATAVGDEVGRPDQAAHGSVVVLANWWDGGPLVTELEIMRQRNIARTVGSKVLVRPSSSDEPLTPFDRILVVDGLLWVKEVVEEGVQVLRRLGRLGFG